MTHLLTRQLKKEIPFEAEEFIQEFRAQPILEVPVGDSPQLGYLGESPPLRLVEFADFQCPACGVATKQIHRLVKGYSGKVQLIFKHFPLDSSCNPYVQVRMHEHACVAAKAAICAQKQDKFKDFYQMLFSNQTLISLEKIKAWAEELKLNTIEFEKCLISEETTLFLQKDIDLANKIGLRSTPTFFANGRKVEGVIDENRLRALLKEYAAMD